MTMKISDETLLHRIWRNQIANLPWSTLVHYANGGVGLVGNRDLDFQMASTEVLSARAKLADEIGPQQLLRRLRGLHAQGWFDSPTSPQGKLRIGFMIHTPLAREAFDTARALWHERGVPEGSEKLPDGRIRMCTKPISEHERAVHAKAIRAHLLATFDGVHPSRQHDAYFFTHVLQPLYQRTA